MIPVHRSWISIAHACFSRKCLFNDIACPNRVKWVGEGAIHTGFHRFTEIGHIVHNKYIFNTKNFVQVEIWKMVWTFFFFLQFLRLRSRRMELANIASEWLRIPTIKGTFNSEWKSKYFSREPAPVPLIGDPRSLQPQRPFWKSFSFYARSAPAQVVI